MRRTIIFISIVCLIFMTVWAESPVFKTDDSKPETYSQLFESDNDKTIEEETEQGQESKPPLQKRFF